MKKEILFFLLLLPLASQGEAFQYQKNSVFVFSDLLFWRAREGSADNWAQNIDLGFVNKNIDIYGAPFKWNASYRVGIGYKEPEKQWDAVLYYTNFQTSASSQKNGQIYSAFLGNFFVGNTDGISDNGAYYQSGNINWRFYFNNLDFELGKTFAINKIVNLRPFAGLKAAFINQNIYTNWQNPINVSNFTQGEETLKNDFWGIGPSIGLNTTWPIYKSLKSSFNLIGNFSGALLLGNWNFKDTYTNNAPFYITTNVSPVHGAAPMVRGLLGIEWTSEFSKANLSIHLGYEAQVWANQMQYYSFNMGRLNNLMSIQGAVFGFCLNL